MISLRNVEKAFSYGPAKTYVLRRIDFDIKPGEFVSIMGPSGAGKSTLLHILGMHDQSWSGEYFFDDVAVHKLDTKKRAALRNTNIGFVFQSYHLLDDQTVFENLELPLSYRDVNKKDRQSIVCDTLDKFQIVGKKDLFPSQLSGGQQQRVAVARAVAGEPSILLADEPTGNLDSTNGEAVMELLRDLHRGGATICMVTHDARYAQHADRIVHLFDGLIVEEEAGANRREVEDARRDARESGLGAIG